MEGDKQKKECKRDEGDACIICKQQPVTKCFGCRKLFCGKCLVLTRLTQGTQVSYCEACFISATAPVVGRDELISIGRSPKYVDRYLTADLIRLNSEISALKELDESLELLASRNIYAIFFAMHAGFTSSIASMLMSGILKLPESIIVRSNVAEVRLASWVPLKRGDQFGNSYYVFRENNLILTNTSQVDTRPLFRELNDMRFQMNNAGESSDQGTKFYKYTTSVAAIVRKDTQNIGFVFAPVEESVEGKTMYKRPIDPPPVTDSPSVSVSDVVELSVITISSAESSKPDSEVSSNVSEGSTL